MKKIIAFLVFLAALVGVGFAAYTFVPASVTVKIFDETYVAATPKGKEDLGLQVNKVVDSVTKEVKQVKDKLEKAVDNTVEQEETGNSKVLPVDSLKNIKINDLIPEKVKNMNLEDVIKDSNVSVNVNGADVRQISDEEKLKIIDMVNKGDFSEIEKILKK